MKCSNSSSDSSSGSRRQTTQNPDDKPNCYHGWLTLVQTFTNQGCMK